jgi:hypothetical protein
MPQTMRSCKCEVRAVAGMVSEGAQRQDHYHRITSPSRGETVEQFAEAVTNETMKCVVDKFPPPRHFLSTTVYYLVFVDCSKACAIVLRV